MKNSNSLAHLDVPRIHPVLQHYKWLESAEAQPLDFTYLSEPMTKKMFGFTASELSQLADIDREQMGNTLSNIELIFLSLTEIETEATVTKQNIQTINDHYEAIKAERHLSKKVRSPFEQVASRAA